MDKDPNQTFLDLLSAAMLDAATSSKMSQLQLTVGVPGTIKGKVVRVIIVPDDMDYLMGGS